MPRKRRDGAEKKSGPKKGPAETAKTNEFEVWSDLTENMAKVAAQEAQRLKQLVVNMKPGKASYTLGDFMLDQMKNSSKLLEATIKAARKA